MNPFEFIGWFGNIILSIGVIPQVIQTWRTHDVSSFNWPFLLMWAFGVLFTFIYIAQGDMARGSFQWPLWLNYLVNILATSYLVYAKYKYGKTVVSD
ncbi:PQ-loop domain-containing transporter [Prolixibacter sp. SD074]|jgi:uncharacterized protein with PQ loop repeat|uniref:PQ-loop domain-containing transporter n=1 Tax=Prolixibacter sp. SD074 TaxID=2652391 RepID=UPI001279149B|nr:PQ-loop domain-containing transporter [Prolixibacter sp. SD074]GET28423.1 hypothetical protein SD074_06250 [Prolixibacter sp. SD074]